MVIVKENINIKENVYGGYLLNFRHGKSYKKKQAWAFSDLHPCLIKNLPHYSPIRGNTDTI